MAKFNFRLPIETELTRKQRRAIDSEEQILLTGVPGSGKTVVSIFRLSNAVQRNEHVILFTYNRMLKMAIRNSATTLGLKAENINNIHKWFYETTGLWLTEYENNYEELSKKINAKFDEILFDEGQDLPLSIYKAFKEKSQVSIGADDAQKLYEVDTTEVKILEIMPNLIRHELDENFRNSFEIFNFAKEFVPNNARAHDEELLRKLPRDNADKPYIYINESLDKNKEMMGKIILANKGANIGILAPDKVLLEIYYKALKDEHTCSIYYNELTEERKLETENNLQNILFTTFKSAKGMEFDIVIMSGFELIDDDRRRQYFVGATRAKSKLFILAIKNLPPIFNKFDESTYILQ